MRQIFQGKNEEIFKTINKLNGKIIEEIFQKINKLNGKIKVEKIRNHSWNTVNSYPEFVIIFIFYHVVQLVIVLK